MNEYGFEWWDVNRTLSYNKLLNFVVGGRGIGKTYGTKKFLINRYMKTGERFIYIRRYQADLEKALPTFFSGVVDDYPDYEFTVGKQGYILANGIEMGYAFPLSLSRKLKGTMFDNYKWLMFDEFLEEDESRSGYLKNEVGVFRNLYETVFRMTDGRCLFLANAVKFFNPYFNAYKLELPYNGRYKVYDDILVELIRDSVYASVKGRTRMGRLDSLTGYAQYAYQSDFKDLNHEFIRPKPNDLVYLQTCILFGERYGLYRQPATGLWWFSVDSQITPSTFAFDADDHTEGSATTLVSNIRKSRHFSTALEAYKNGMLFFDKKRAKNAFFNMLTYLR